ncbi:hypothetical protein LguiB_029479 [Lonicera macranthoides]
MYGITKAKDVVEHTQTPIIQLRNEALQDVLKMVGLVYVHPLVKLIDILIDNGKPPQTATLRLHLHRHHTPSSSPSPPPPP